VTAPAAGASDGARASLTEDEQQARRLALAELMPSTPYISGLGIVIERYEPDDVLLRLPFRADLTNDGVSYHGGAIASLMDTAGGAVSWSNHDFTKGTRASTVSMSIQYVSACRGLDLWCRGRALRRGRELIFCELTVTDPDGGVVAHGHLTYRIV
jgi:uncharacterized protein (TIGR00369 family)